VPIVAPVRNPVEEPMVATAVLLLLHVPKIVVSLNVITESRHTLGDPLMIFGKGFTVRPATLPDDKLLIHPSTLVREVTITVVEPAFIRSVEGIVKVPVPAAIVIVAVWAVTLFAPLRL